MVEPAQVADQEGGEGDGGDGNPYALLPVARHQLRDLKLVGRVGRVEVVIAEGVLIAHCDDDGSTRVYGQHQKIGHQGHFEGHKLEHLYDCHHEDHRKDIREDPILASEPPAKHHRNARQHSQNVDQANGYLLYPELLLQASNSEEEEQLNRDDGPGCDYRGHVGDVEHYLEGLGRVETEYSHDEDAGCDQRDHFVAILDAVSPKGVPPSHVGSKYEHQRCEEDEDESPVLKICDIVGDVAVEVVGEAAKGLYLECEYVEVIGGGEGGGTVVEDADGAGIVIAG